MDWSQVTASAVTGIFSGSFIMAFVAIYTARQSKKASVSSDEREARRDMITDRDSLLDRYDKEISLLRAENIALSTEIQQLRIEIIKLLRT